MQIGVPKETAPRERRVALAPGRYEIGRRAFKDGCLILGLRKL